MDQAHEQVTDLGTVSGFIKQGILAVQDSLFQGLLAEIVVQGRAGHSEEKGQCRPVFEHVADGLSQTAVGLYQMLIQLFMEPGVELFHQRAAVVLMKTQPVFGGHLSFFGNLIIFVYPCQGFEDMAALLREALPYLNKLSAAMGQTSWPAGF